MDSDPLQHKQEQLLEQWVAAISPTDEFDVRSIRAHVTTLTAKISQLLIADVFSIDEAQKVGEVLSELSLYDEATLRKLTEILIAEFADTLSIAQTQRLCATVRELTIGFHRFSNHHMMQKAQDLLDMGNISLSFLAGMTLAMGAGITGHILVPTLELKNELIKREDEILQVYIEKLEVGSKKMRELSNDIRDLAKIQTRKLELYPETINLAEFLDELAKSTSNFLNSKNNIFQIHNSFKLEFMLVDKDRLRQILLNLLSNANKFTENGCITLSVSNERNNEKEIVTFSVSDTGLGIEPEKLKDLFEWPVKPLRSLQKVDKNNLYRGMGLGLAICNRLCYLMDGKISAKSEVGKGTTVTVVLPAHYNGKIE